MFRNKKRRFILIFIITIIVLFFSRISSTFNHYTEAISVAIEEPLLWISLRPVVLWRNCSLFYSRLSEALHENQELKKENAILKKRAQAFLILKTENKALRLLLGYHSQIFFQRVAVGQVFADNHSAFLHTIVVNVGWQDHIQPNMVVLNDKTVVGRVISVNQFASRVLLLSDPVSRISVTNRARDLHAIMAGSGDNQGTLLSVSDGAFVSKGEEIITSGLDGIFPAGLDIGIISQVKTGHIIVKFYSNLSALSYVQFFSYHLQHPLDVPEMADE